MPSADTVEDSLKAFLHENADELSFGVSDENLKVIQDVPTPIRRVVRFQQLQDGIPVFGAIVMVQLDKNDRVRQLYLGQETRTQIVLPTTDKEMSANDSMKVASESLGDFTLRQ